MQMQHRYHRRRYWKMKLDIVFVLNKHREPSSSQGLALHEMQLSDNQQSTPNYANAPKQKR
jgi:hypothetical protein